MQASHKTFRTKRTLAKKAKQNRQVPQWIRMRTDNKIRFCLNLIISFVNQSVDFDHPRKQVQQ